MVQYYIFIKGYFGEIREIKNKILISGNVAAI
jgi:hypothetical protein